MLGMAIVALVLGACGGGGEDEEAGPGPTASTTTTPSSAPSKTSDPPIEITGFGPSGSNVTVTFQITNTTGSEFRFEWSKFVLSSPDGRTTAPYRDPDSAPYELVGVGHSLANGGTFYFDEFTPGHYSIAYDGGVLAEKDL